MNQITDHDWEYKGIDGAVENDWFITPVILLTLIVALITVVGPDRFIDVISSFIVAIRAS